ncbi:GNAT family N-acetyltransferase [Rhodococcus sp. IEGM 1401]|uniref:GNAT family N-acetyltransferase n=1 Tax=unclassified Rhodococcus (in: high G+C Gram-positive bacteria) TaxID=192944 RepID=UPI0022B39CF4|nr:MULTISPECIES: GNAT family N-acetyltransferase [unclassified Rhodococcus (in: high G+C Gram-positive bacteria)]MCZ4562695.1 GNAT family N-acetyltransferase [Rhodococcus sp. IEGM 1401]MDI9922792.1 GNAT family N-acetyltransferase [Rhodococcus sp. IEGM 1372]MDV8035340.1 GNAT family N-acetyltransferase [Rhodococcus sp. IEGM 1414]
MTIHPRITWMEFDLSDGSTCVVREAVASDLESIVALLVDDPLGVTRESADEMDRYRAAFEDISSDPRNLQVVVVHGDAVVATLQLTFIPGLARGGALRAQIEAVRVDAQWRSRGLGGALIRWAIDEAKRWGCALVQLTSDASRTDAHRFYTRLGFVDSHVGYKMTLGTTA